MILDNIKQANDIKEVSPGDYPQLAKEIREFLIESLSRTGGHLASNLGAVELTMALHIVFDLPADKIIWDVGHQCYTHKILTGRRDEFYRLRKDGGISGFPRRSESSCDSFDTGHSSNSISAGLGYVSARELRGDTYRVVSVIGDGAMTGGMAYEAMNNLAELKSNYIIVLNDNEMSISENVGGISKYLGRLRTADAYTGLKEGSKSLLRRIPTVGPAVESFISKTKDGIKQLMIQGMFFEEMGITYLGPVDGHDTRMIMRLLNEAKKVEGAVLVHVITKKGKGYDPAVRHPARFHGTAPFEIKTGVPIDNSSKAAYTDVFSTVMRKMGDRNKNVVAVTAAMPDGTGLKRFRNMFSDHCFDVGIAEEHAVTFAAGLALGGMVPVVAVYSTFLQRAVDQVMEDVCMQNLHVIFAIDRAGIVGSDGVTHQGCFDLTYLSMMPNMTVMAPKNKWELSDMLKFAIQYNGPIAIRYPRGEAYDGLEEYRAPLVMGKAEVISRGYRVALLAVGSMVKVAREVEQQLLQKGYRPTLVNMRFVKPFDTGLLAELAADHSLFVTMEENVKNGGFGERVSLWLSENQMHVDVLNVSIPDVFVEHGSVEKIFERLGLDAASVVERIEKQ